MSHQKLCRRVAQLISISLCLVFCQAAFAQSRISSAIRSDQQVAVKGTTPALLLAKSKEVGRIAGNQKLGRMVLLLAPTAQQDKAAAKYVAAQHDAASPSFHKWLTPAQFGKQFGIDQSDAAQVQQWLESQGLTVNEVAQSRRFIVFSGNVAQVETAFATQMRSYTYKDKSFISNSSDIQIPAALRNVVKGVVRLHSDPSSPAIVMSKNKVHFQKKGGQFTSFDSSHYMAPADFAKIYNVQPLYDAGINGTGQSIAIVGRSNILVQDVRDFRNLLGLPVNDPNVIINGDDPGVTTDVAEATLDVTWAGAIAPMATIDFVVSQSNFSDGVDVSAAYIVDHNLAPVMSTSYGACEADIGPIENAFYNSIWQQAAAQGITSFVSSGDNGGAGCDAPGGGYFSSGTLAVNGIASTPYNVAVGGTQFDDTDNPDAYWSSTNDPTTGQSVLGYIPEKVWNESSNDPNYISLYAGSGGVSSIYAKPDWQAGAGVPSDGMRDLPDISLTASSHDGYLLCLASYCSGGDYFFVFGGTSASSPAAAGIMALVNQKMGGQPQGMANYVFYRLATVPGIYHDTTVGNNKVPDPDGQYTVGYDATPGYDLATGLGSMDVNAMVNSWQAASTGATTATTLALGTGQSASVVHGTPISFQATVNCAAAGSCTAPTGSVTLSASSSTAATTGAGTGLLTPLATSSVATIPTATVPGGSYNVSARYSGDGKYSPSVSTAVPVTVSPESSKTYVGAIAGGYFATGPITVGYGLSWPIGIVVAGDSGFGYPSGQMTLTADGQPLTTGGVYDYSSGTYTPSTLTLNYGENSTLLSPGPKSQASSVSYVLPSPSLGVGTHQVVASYPGDPSFGKSQGGYSFIVSQVQGIIQDFFAAGSTVANTPVKFIAQVGLANNGFAPYTGTITLTDITGPTPVVLGTGAVDSSLYGGYWESTVTVTTAGTHIFQLNFTGDKNVKGIVQTYNNVVFTGTGDSYVSLSADVTNTLGGQPVTLTANVASDIRLHVATGTITFLNGATTLGTATPDATGNAVLVTTAIAPGTNNITASYSGDGVLNPSVSNPITETVSNYIVQAAPAALTIVAGQSGSTLVNLIPLGGFTQAVQLACTGLPANVTCNFNKSAVTLDGINPATVSLALHTGNAVGSNESKTNLWAIPSAVTLAGLLLVPFGRRRRIWSTMAVLMLVAVTFAATGCGGGSSVNPNNAAVGSYTIQVTATSAGTPTISTPLVVNITK